MINTPPTQTSPEVVTSSQVSGAWGWAAGVMIVGGALFGSRPVFGLRLRVLTGITLLMLVFPYFAGNVTNNVTGAQNNCRTFSETGRSVCGRFLEYWDQTGGLAQHGFPISGVVQEKSDIDAKTYDMQYFERAVFEYHPENQPPYDVLLSLLGALEYRWRWGTAIPPTEKANTDNALTFHETGKTVGGWFRAYWEQHGGLPLQGYPITNEFKEANRMDGEMYTVQYFERAVFEYHPKNQPPYNVLLSHLGRFYQERKKGEACDAARKLPGSVIAQGTNTVPGGDLGLKTYRLEEVTMPSPLTCTVPVPNSTKTGLTPKTLTYDRFWRLTITSERYIYESSLPTYVWLDDIPIGRAGGQTHVARVYDRTLLREGATLAVGQHGPEFPLPEKLHLSSPP